LLQFLDSAAGPKWSIATTWWSAKNEGPGAIP
jgi:hypothetical protein